MDNLSSENSANFFVNDKKIYTLETDDVQCDINEATNVYENLCQKCVVCSMTTDQHLLVKCDTCKSHTI
jgi:hypothetical protein